MIKINKFFKTSMLTMLFVSFLTVAAYGQEPGSYPVAEPRFGSSEIIWVPLVNYSFLDLTIARPDGTLFSRTFEAGSTPYADLSDILGKGNLDGSYIYELRAMMEPKQKRGEGDEVEIRYSTAPLVQTGGFSVLDRTIMNPEEQEPDRDKGISFSSSQPGLSGVQDFVINDDLIVVGSACIGFDCVNGESFGFDTIRLKENNLRIKFDDTSTLSSFPRNDWQLTANDSANGGASKFSIDDITNARTPFTVEAGARTNSLYVDDGGRLGIRTSTPALEIHVVDGDTPGLRLQQDGSSGFAPQTWDIAGNETNFFIRDVTGGSRLPFRIRPGAPTSSIDINNSGLVGFNNASPQFPLHLKSSSGTSATAVFQDSSGTQVQISAGTNFVFIGSKTANDFRLTVNDSPKMTLTTDGKVGVGVTSVAAANKLEVDNGARLTTGGVWTDASSIDFKENIKALTSDDALETLNGLNPVRYNYKTEKEEEYVGFIAEQVPELVATKNRKGLSPMDIVAVLTKVVQEQQKTISELKEKVAAFEKNKK